MKEYGLILHSGDHEDILIHIGEQNIKFDSIIKFTDDPGSGWFLNEFSISREVAHDAGAWGRAAQLIGGLILNSIISCPEET